MRFLIKNIKKKQLNNIIYAIVQLFMLFFIYLIIDIQDKGVQIQFDLIIATIVYLFNFMINTDNFKEVDAFYWFIGLTYVFYFGQHIVYFLAGNSALPIFRNMLDVENIKVCDFYTIFGVSPINGTVNTFGITYIIPVKYERPETKATLLPLKLITTILTNPVYPVSVSIL